MDNRLAHPAEGEGPAVGPEGDRRTLGASAAELQQLPERRGRRRATRRSEPPVASSTPPRVEGQGEDRPGVGLLPAYPGGRGPGARGAGASPRRPRPPTGCRRRRRRRRRGPARHLRGQGDLPEPAVGVDVVEDHEPSVRRHEQGRAPADQGDADDLPPDLDAADDPPGGDLDDRRRAVLQARRDPPAGRVEVDPADRAGEVRGRVGPAPGSSGPISRRIDPGAGGGVVVADGPGAAAAIRAVGRHRVGGGLGQLEGRAAIGHVPHEGLGVRGRRDLGPAQVVGDREHRIGVPEELAALARPTRPTTQTPSTAIRPPSGAKATDRPLPPGSGIASRCRPVRTSQTRTDWSLEAEASSVAVGAEGDPPDGRGVARGAKSKRSLRRVPDLDRRVRRPGLAEARYVPVGLNTKPSARPDAGPAGPGGPRLVGRGGPDRMPPARRGQPGRPSGLRASGTLSGNRLEWGVDGRAGRAESTS